MKTICIDPGHGGADPGAVNGKYHEADAALAIALIIGDTLKNWGYQVVYTRTENTTLKLSDRTNTANNAGADLFVSIHLNSFSDATANGIETLVHGNAAPLAKELAKTVQEALCGATGWKDRGVQVRNDLYVLKHTRMPAILVETGFISNPEECAKLFDTENWQKMIALQIANAISEVLD